MTICALSHLTVVLVTRLIVLLTIIVASVHLLLHRHTIAVCLILLTVIRYAFLTRSKQSHIVLVAASLVPIRALAEHNDFVLGTSPFPAAKDEQVRADGG